MSDEVKAGQPTPAVPTVTDVANAADSEQPADGELSDKELGQVSGGVWRNGKWFPW